MAFENQDLPPYWTELPRNHPYRQEMERWNKPYTFQEFPRMVYRARKRPDGVVTVFETVDARCLEPGENPAPGKAEQWSRGNYMEAKDATEFQKAMESGWRPDPQAALEFFHAREQSIADAAAHRHYEDRNMSERAKAEAAAIEGESSEHLPEIPEARRKPGPKPKIATA